MELALVALVLVLFYDRPPSLTALASSTLGKALLVAVVAVLAHNFGLTAGVLAAVGLMLLVSPTKEGLGAAGSKRIRTQRMLLNLSQPQGTTDGGNVAGTLTGQETTARSTTYGGHATAAACKSDSDCGVCNNTCSSGNCLMTLSTTGDTKATGLSCTNAVDCAPCAGTCRTDLGGVCEISAIDQVSLGRSLQTEALVAGMAATQQANGQTNNGLHGGERFGNYF